MSNYDWEAEGLQVNPLNNIGLIHMVMKSLGLTIDSHTYEDLLQEGYIGLDYAARRYDATKRCEFATFAVPCIRGYILKALIRQNSPSLVSKPAYKRNEESINRKVLEAIIKDRKTQGHEPLTVTEAADLLEVSEEEIFSIVRPEHSFRVDMFRLGAVHEGRVDNNATYNEVASILVCDDVESNLEASIISGELEDMAAKDPNVAAYLIQVRENLTVRDLGDRLGISHQGAKNRAELGARRVRERFARTFREKFGYDPPMDNPIEEWD